MRIQVLRIKVSIYKRAKSVQLVAQVRPDTSLSLLNKAYLHCNP